jgi:hypothetical protein
MTTAALGSPSIRTVGRFGAWLSVRHSLRIEATAALTLYGLYELARGLVGADTSRSSVRCISSSRRTCSAPSRTSPASRVCSAWLI